MKATYSEILFLFPNFEEESLTFTFTYHLGASYILAYLKDKGIYATQFIHKGPIGLDELTNKILKQRLRIVGLTCYDTNYYFVKLISQLLKKKEPELIIIVGGPTATFSDKLIMDNNLAIDICIRGEGEYTVYELIKGLRVSLDISDIEGITYRLRGRLMRTPDRPLIRGDKNGEELDILPSPYLRGIFPPIEHLGIVTSRGCIFKCVYCNFSAMSRWTIRYHSVERVISELKAIYKGFQSNNEKMGDRLVMIFDDAFSLDMERAKQICRRIIEEKIILPYWTQTRADSVDRELLCLMYEAGFRGINFGLESASPKVLHIIKKVCKHSVNVDNLMPEKKFIEKLRKNVKLAKRLGLNPTVSVIMGLPGATERDDKKTIGFVRQLKVKRYYHDYLCIFSGTELFRIHRRYGLSVRQSLTLLPNQTEYTYDVYKLPEMDNSYQRFIKRRQIEIMMKIMTGDYEEQQAKDHSVLLFKNYSIDDKTIEWLSRSIVISPVIGFVGSYFDEGFACRNIKEMISAGLPIINLYLFTKLNRKGANIADLDFESNRYEVIHARGIPLITGKSLSKLGVVEFIPFVNYSRDRLALLNSKKEENDKIIFTLSTLDDVENLIKLTSDRDKVILPGDTLKFDCYFLDECRWSNKDCPAVRFPRAIIENDGLIIPCFNGKPIAKVGDERPDVIKNLRLLWDDMKRGRGCGDCLVRDNCSKCLFPYPINSKEYCRIRRKKHTHTLSLSKFFKLFKIIRDIRNFDDGLPRESKIDRIVGIFDDELMVVDISKKKYIYHCPSDTLHDSFK